MGDTPGDRAVPVVVPTPLCLSKNPRDADPMTRVQAELDETKIILVRTRRAWGPSGTLGDGDVLLGGWDPQVLCPSCHLHPQGHS